MAVRLRLKRLGRTHRPYYRIEAFDQRTKRDGRSIEQLGNYDPLEKDAAKQIVMNVERIQYWLGVGAQPSETVASMLKRRGVKWGKATQPKKEKKKVEKVAAKKAKPKGKTKAK